MLKSQKQQKNSNYTRLQFSRFIPLFVNSTTSVGYFLQECFSLLISTYSWHYELSYLFFIHNYYRVEGVDEGQQIFITEGAEDKEQEILVVKNIEIGSSYAEGTPETEQAE